MMKRTILLFTIILYSLAGFSQWQPFYTDQKPYYQIKENSSFPADTTIHQFHFDTIIDYGSFKVMHSNYTNPDFNGCYDVVNQSQNLGNTIYSKHYIRPDSILLKNDTTYFIFETQGQADSILFLPQSQPNDVWTSSINNSSNYNTLQFTCDSVGVGTVLLNLNDSLKYFSVKAFQNTTSVASVYDNLKIILSKNYGFKQLIAFRDYNQQEFSLVGLDSANVKTGFNYPDFSAYFHLAVGDVIIWKEHSPPAGPFHMGYTKYHKDSVTNSLITPDSVVYNFNRITAGGGNTSSYTMRHLRSNFTGLNTTSSVYTMGTKISPEYFFGLMGDELLETYGAYITNDTIVNRLYSFVGDLFDTSNCSIGYVTDNGFICEYNTYYGLNSFKHYSFYDVYFTIAGSIINGVQEGVEWSNIIANVDEVEMKNQIHVYPNPSNDGNITIFHQGIFQIEIFSMEGKLMLSKNVSGKNEFTEINLPKGFYFIQLLDKNNQLSTKKVVITGN